MIAQIASGLADAHAAGLVHRDIKPANVLLRIRTDSVRAYLADFGIARQVNADSNLTMAGVTVGTPTYMAPELHTGGQSGPASDVYSLGCLLWAAVSGHAPYSGTSDYQIVNAHLAPRSRSCRRPARWPRRSTGCCGSRWPSSPATATPRPAPCATTSGPRCGCPRVPRRPGPDRCRSPTTEPSSSGRRTGLIVALVALVVLAVVGAGVAYAVTRDDDGEPSSDPSSESEQQRVAVGVARPRPAPESPTTAPPTPRPTRRSRATTTRRSWSSPRRSRARRASIRALPAAWRRSWCRTSGCRGWSRRACSPPTWINNDPMSGGCRVTCRPQCSRPRSTARCRPSAP